MAQTAIGAEIISGNFTIKLTAPCSRAEVHESMVFSGGYKAGPPTGCIASSFCWHRGIISPRGKGQ